MMMARVEFEWELNFYSGMKRVAAAMTTSTSSSLDVEIFFLLFFLFLSMLLSVDVCCCRLVEKKKVLKSLLGWNEKQAGGWCGSTSQLHWHVEKVYMRVYTRERRTRKKKWNSQHNDIQFDFNLFLPPSSLSVPPPPTWFRRTHLNNPISWHD